MPKYLVKTPIQMGKQFEPGQTIQLSEQQAAAMPWAVEALPEEVRENGKKKKTEKQ